MTSLLQEIKKHEGALEEPQAEILTGDMALTEELPEELSGGIAEPQAQGGLLSQLEQAEYEKRQQTEREFSEGRTEQEVLTELSRMDEEERFPQASFPVQDRTQTRAGRELKETGLLHGESITKLLWVVPLLSLTPDPREKGAILNRVFPHVGISEDVAGNVMATNTKNQKQVILNKPNLSGTDIMDALWTIPAFSWAGLMGRMGMKLAGSLAAKQTGKKLTAAKVGGAVAAGGTAAAITQTGIEEAQESLGGTFDPEEIPTAAAFQGLGEIIEPAVKAGARKVVPAFRRAKEQAAQKKLKKLKMEEFEAEQLEDIVTTDKNVEEAKEIMRHLKTPIYKAQQTLRPSHIKKQAFLLSDDATSEKARKALVKQNKFVSEDVDDFLKMIAPPEALRTGARKVRDAALSAIVKAKDLRSEGTRAMYERAFNAMPPVDIKPFLRDLEKVAADYPSEGGNMSAVLEKIRKLTSPKRIIGGEVAPSLRVLHGAKMEIDDILEDKTKLRMGPTLKFAVSGLKESLLRQMKDASELYILANKKFQAMSGPVNELEKSVIGDISKVDDKDLKTVSRKLFNLEDVDPTHMLYAKKIIQGRNPQAWDEIVRVQIEKQLGDASKLSEIAEDETLQRGAENMAKEYFRGLFGYGPQGRKKSKMMYNALDGEVKDRFKWVEKGLKRAAQGWVVGSPTAQYLRIGEKLGENIYSTLVGAVRFFTPTDPTMLADEVVSGWAYDRNVKALASLMLDENWAPEWEKLRGMSPTAKKASKKLLEMFKASRKLVDLSEAKKTPIKASIQSARAIPRKRQEEKEQERLMEREAEKGRLIDELEDIRAAQ